MSLAALNSSVAYSAAPAARAASNAPWACDSSLEGGAAHPGRAATRQTTSSRRAWRSDGIGREYTGRQSARHRGVAAGDASPRSWRCVERARWPAARRASARTAAPAGRSVARRRGAGGAGAGHRRAGPRRARRRARRAARVWRCRGPGRPAADAIDAGLGHRSEPRRRPGGGDRTRPAGRRGPAPGSSARCLAGRRRPNTCCRGSVDCARSTSACCCSTRGTG